MINLLPYNHQLFVVSRIQNNVKYSLNFLNCLWIHVWPGIMILVTPRQLLAIAASVSPVWRRPLLSKILGQPAPVGVHVHS